MIESFDVYVHHVTCDGCGDTATPIVHEIVATRNAMTRGFGREAEAVRAKYVATQTSVPDEWGYVAGKNLCPECMHKVRRAFGTVGITLG